MLIKKSRGVMKGRLKKRFFKRSVFLSLIFILSVFFLNLQFVSSVITIVSPITSSNHTGTVVFNVSYVNASVSDITDAVNASFYYNNSAGVWTLIGSTDVCVKSAEVASCNATLSIASILEGTYSINATLSNTTDFDKGASIITYGVTLDSTAPNVSTFYTTTNNGNYSGIRTLNVSVSEGGIGISSVYFNVTYVNGTQISFNRGSISGVYYNSSIDTTLFQDGRYNVTVYANDTLNNLNNSKYISFIVDNIAPNVSAFFTTNTNNGNYSGIRTLNVSVSDGGAGIDSVYFNITNSSGVQINFTKASASGIYYNISIDTSKFTDGMYNVTVYANDTAVNTNLNKTEKVQITFDNTAPTATFTCSPSQIYSGNTITCSCSPNDAIVGVNSSATSYVTSPSTSDTGTHTVSCSFADLLGNSGSVTTTYIVELSSSSSGSSSSSSSSSSATIKPVEKTKTWAVVLASTPVTMSGFAQGTGVSEIQLELTENSSNVKVVVDKYESKPANVSVAKEDFYKYLHITTTNLENLKKATMKIQVEKSWVSDKGLSKEEVGLFRFNEDSETWEKLTTTFKEEDTTYYYYEVELNHFSYFVIASDKIVTPEIGTTDEGTGIPSILNNSIVTWIIVGVIVLVAVIAGGFLMKKKKK